MAGILVVFNFNNTIIECDSDNWVTEEFGCTDYFVSKLSDMIWIDAMDKTLQKLHADGITIRQIEDCLKRAPVNEYVVKLIKSAKSHGCELIIVSNSNIFFIETVLKHHGLVPYFSNIYTNRALIEDVGVNEGPRLKILAHQFEQYPHSCELCHRNMCKGMVIGRVFEGIQASRYPMVIAEIGSSQHAERKKKIVCIGDGSDAFCLVLRLREGDTVMPRHHSGLWCKLIESSPSRIKAEVRAWDNDEKLDEIFSQVINRITLEESGSSSSDSAEESSASAEESGGTSSASTSSAPVNAWNCRPFSSFDPFC